MTMINCLTLGHTGYMMCDTAVYGRKLDVLWFEDKISALPKQRMLFGSRGLVSFGPHLVKAIDDRFGSYDEFVRHAEEFLRSFDDEHPFVDESVQIAGRSGAELSVVGFSARHGGYKCWGARLDGGRGSARARTLELAINDDSALEIGPGIDRDRVRAAGVFGRDGIAANPEGCLLHLAQLQRWETLPVEGRFRHFIGGEIILAMIDDAGITKRTLKDWGDKIGTVIVPKELPPSPKSWLCKDEDAAILQLPVRDAACECAPLARAA